MDIILGKLVFTKKNLNKYSIYNFLLSIAATDVDPLHSIAATISRAKTTANRVRSAVTLNLAQR